MENDRLGIVFVCTGNICRSPLAQAVFEKLATERGLRHRFEVDSCGTTSYHEGDPPDSRMSRTARSHGVPMSHRARALDDNDFRRNDLILAMDAENLRIIRARLPADPRRRADSGSTQASDERSGSDGGRTRSAGPGFQSADPGRFPKDEDGSPLPRITFFRDFDPEGDGREVPDPYYGGTEGFERVYRIVERTCAALLDRFETSGREGLINHGEHAES